VKSRRQTEMPVEQRTRATKELEQFVPRHRS
jgi:hypothetical protein